MSDLVPDCEICLEPDSGHALVTIEVPEQDPCPINFCRECLQLVFEAMVVRYNAAVTENNESVRQFMRMFGIEKPT